MAHQLRDELKRFINSNIRQAGVSASPPGEVYRVFRIRLVGIVGLPGRRGVAGDFGRAEGNRAAGIDEGSAGEVLLKMLFQGASLGSEERTGLGVAWVDGGLGKLVVS